MDLLFTILLLIIALHLLDFLLITIYNRLQKLRNGAEAALSQVGVAMKKRLDMIEQLLDSLKSYANFEKNVLENITSMRSSLSNAKPDDLREIEGRSRGIDRNILAVAEDYPQLKTSEIVNVTLNAIKGVEDEISRHRYTYNNIIQEFNTMADTVPSSFVAVAAGMKKLEYLSFEEDELRRMGYLASEEIEPKWPEVKWD